MIQEKVVSKIINEICVNRMIARRFIPHVTAYIAQAWGAGYDHGRAVGSHPKKVAKLDDKGNVLAVYNSASEAGRQNGLTKHVISMVCLGKQDKAGEKKNGIGYSYKYIEEVWQEEEQ